MISSDNWASKYSYGYLLVQIIGQSRHGVPNLSDGWLVGVWLTVRRSPLRRHIGQEIEQVVQVDGICASCRWAG